MINNVETSRRNFYTCLHPFTHWRQMRKSHSDAVEITLRKLVSLASIRLRGTVMAANRKRHSYCDVTTIRQTRHFRFWRVRFQDGDAVDLGKLGRGPLSSVFCFLSVYALGPRVYVVIIYKHRTTVLLWYNGLCDIPVLFMYGACQCVWHIAPIRFNNVSLCPSIFI